jgi:hypothetical protein
MDGLTAMQHSLHEKICPMLVVSSLTQKGAVTTIEALELGAFDFVGKPDGSVSAHIDNVAANIRRKIKEAHRSRNMSGRLGKRYPPGNRLKLWPSGFKPAISAFVWPLPRELRVFITHTVEMPWEICAPAKEIGPSRRRLTMATNSCFGKLAFEDFCRFRDFLCPQSRWVYVSRVFGIGRAY